MAGFNDVPLIQNLAVPAVCLLGSFLCFFPQYVFHRSTLDPGPPSRAETVVFNGLIVCLWLAYFKTVTVDPGRYVFPGRVVEDDGKWCKKCVAPKPPRAHHCRHCGRCVPKMDHHCPWTRNCVSMTTFPHFLRFLFYTNLALWMLGRLLWLRFYALWETRHLPSYLGPSLQALIALAITSLICLFITLALGIMLFSTVKSWLCNCTMIEGWELDRHEAAVERGGRDWWDITLPDGDKIRFERVEFPYDIGFFSNMAQAMGTANVLLWLFPLAGNPTIGKDGQGAGWTWRENGFNRKEGMWPPPDPAKIRQAARAWPAAQNDVDELLTDAGLSPEARKRAFKQRQEEDARRRKSLLAELEEVDDYEFVDDMDDCDDTRSHGSHDGTSDWMNSDGERLRDYGVDEEAEATDTDTLHPNDDDVPIGEILRRRKVTHGGEAP
ncbi:hypothetical protein CDD83_7217 [Cordyceps sp. RAO-2017]|nr:hypothetical protein CDD83_7217 [Cordyceps sp. RAO-2017]